MPAEMFVFNSITCYNHYVRYHLSQSQNKKDGLHGLKVKFFQGSLDIRELKQRRRRRQRERQKSNRFRLAKLKQQMK